MPIGKNGIGQFEKPSLLSPFFIRSPHAKITFDILRKHSTISPTENQKQTEIIISIPRQYTIEKTATKIDYRHSTQYEPALTDLTKSCAVMAL
jgi:hypothetical protein